MKKMFTLLLLIICGCSSESYPPFERIPSDAGVFNTNPTCNDMLITPYPGSQVKSDPDWLGTPSGMAYTKTPVCVCFNNQQICNVNGLDLAQACGANYVSQELIDGCLKQGNTKIMQCNAEIGDCQKDKHQ